MKAKVMTLHEVLSEIFGIAPASETDSMTRDIERRVQQRLDNLARYKKDVVEQIGRVTQEVLRVLNTDHCEHDDHRMLPQSSKDMAAVYNVLVHIHKMFHDSYSVALREIVNTANRMLEQQVDEPPNPAADALQAVLKQALTIIISAMAAHAEKPNALEIMKEFNQRLPETMARFSEELMTGKPAIHEENSNVCKH